MSAEILQDKYPAMSIEDVVLCSDIAEIFSNHGITIPLPWEGDLDDLECERFNGLLRAVNRVKETERERCASIAGKEAAEENDIWLSSGMLDTAAGARGYCASRIGHLIRGEI